MEKRKGRSRRQASPRPTARTDAGNAILADRARDALLAVALVVTLAIGMGIAGALDYSDRTEGLGADMRPSAAWLAGTEG